MEYELIITNGTNSQIPVVLDDIQLTRERNQAAKLTFSTVKDANLDYTEGNHVVLNVDKTPMFNGFVFSKQRQQVDLIKVTAYDQMRYLKNKDNYFGQNQTVTEMISSIASDFLLRLGNVANTSFRLERIDEMNSTLLDIILNGLDRTLEATGEMYVLWDDYGKLSLTNIRDMYINNFAITQDNAVDYDYESTIDRDTYNQIKLGYKNPETGSIDTTVTRSTADQNRWGVLQYYEEIKEPDVGNIRGDALLNYYGLKSRRLTVRNVVGDLRIKAGSRIPVYLNLGDMIANTTMMVQRVTHKFGQNDYMCDVVLIGGEFSA